MMKLRILVVRDGDDSAEIAARVTTLGHDVVTVTAVGHDLAAATNGSSPELLLIHAAPGRGSDAIETAAASGRQRALPTVIIGAHEEESVAGGADSFAFLAPPFTDRELALSLELAVARHRTERTVHELEAFFDVSLDMFCFLGFDGYFRRLNRAWERTLGYTREELMSRPFIEFVHPDDRERTLDQNAKVRAGGHALLFENRYACNDGSYRWFLWNATPLVAEGVIYSVARDITEFKNAEQERIALVRRLETSLAEVRTLREILPICMYCRKIRDDEDYWQTVEAYISRHTGSRFSHAICPSCMQTEVEPELWDI